MSKLDSALEALETQEKESKKKLDETQAKLDQSQEEVDKLKKELEETKSNETKKLDELLKVRAGMEEVAKKCDVKTKNEDGSLKEIKDNKVEVIKSQAPKFDAEGKTEDYINARYDAVVESIDASEFSDASNKLGEFRKNAQHTDAKDKDPRAAFMNKTQDLYKEKEEKN